MTTLQDAMLMKRTKAARVRSALLEFEPSAEITEEVLEGGAPGHEQIILRVAIPGLEWEQVMPRMITFRLARRDDLLAEVGDDVCIVTK